MAEGKWHPWRAKGRDVWGKLLCGCSVATGHALEICCSYRNHMENCLCGDAASVSNGEATVSSSLSNSLFLKTTQFFEQVL